MTTRLPHDLVFAILSYCPWSQLLNRPAAWLVKLAIVSNQGPIELRLTLAQLSGDHKLLQLAALFGVVTIGSEQFLNYIYCLRQACQNGTEAEIWHFFLLNPLEIDLLMVFHLLQRGMVNLVQRMRDFISAPLGVELGAWNESLARIKALYINIELAWKLDPAGFYAYMSSLQRQYPNQSGRNYIRNRIGIVEPYPLTKPLALFLLAKTPKIAGQFLPSHGYDSTWFDQATAHVPKLKVVQQLYQRSLGLSHSPLVLPTDIDEDELARYMLFLGFDNYVADVITGFEQISFEAADTFIYYFAQFSLQFGYYQAFERLIKIPLDVPRIIAGTLGIFWDFRLLTIVKPLISEQQLDRDILRLTLRTGYIIGLPLLPILAENDYYQQILAL